MRFILAVVLMVSLTACTSSRTWVASPMESKINGEVYHYHNLVVLKDKADMFHATESRSWMENCKSKIEKPVTQEQWDYPYQDCARESEYMANIAPSVSQQAVTPIVSTAVGAAGFAAGMHQLGRGIAKSGSRTTNNNSTSSDGGDSSSESSASAKMNSDNVTKNHNNQTYNNHNKTNINSGNHFGGKH
ncbi:MAG: hypothetical protein ACRCZI_06720 [Cetobacterium sp.]